jgi:hypothetical protein
MSKVAIAVVAFALVGAACTGGGGELTTSSTTSPSPVTTLPPADTTTSTSPNSEATTTTKPEPTNDCVVVSDVSVDEYAKACTVLGIVIRSGEAVDDAAFGVVSDRIYNMLITRPDLSGTIVSAGIEGRVIGTDQRITALPEFTELYELFPGIDWDGRERAYPGSVEIPYFAGAEENLLCLEDDRNEGEDMFVRVFGLTVRRFGLDVVDPSTSNAINQAYGRAIAAGLWKNTLAEINSDEYWMEGVQSYFDANLENIEEDREPNSSHNQVNTRDELRAYDPPLWAVANSVFGDGDWRPTCPT